MKQRVSWRLLTQSILSLSETIFSAVQKNVEKEKLSDLERGGGERETYGSEFQIKMQDAQVRRQDS